MPVLVNLSEGEITILFDRDGGDGIFRAYPHGDTPKAARWLAKNLPAASPDEAGYYRIGRADVLRLIRILLDEQGDTKKPRR
jgi:hypothetical protein